MQEQICKNLKNKFKVRGKELKEEGNWAYKPRRQKNEQITM